MSQMKAIQDELLTEASSAYIPSGYISEMLLPAVNVKLSTGKLGKYGTSHLRIENTVKAGRGKYRRVEPIVRLTDSYQIEGHGLEGLVTEDDYDNVQKPFDAEQDEALGLTSLIWLEKEFSVASTLTNPSVITQNTTLSGTSQYSDYDNSNPIQDFATARSAVKAGCGALANLAAMSWEVYNILRYHPQILDALGFKYTKPGGLSLDDLASAMGVGKILLGEAMYESAKEGQTSALAPCWGKHIVFGVFPERAQVRQVSVGYMVRKSGQAPRRVFKWDVNNPPNATAILCDDSYDAFISNANAAYLIEDAIA